MIALRDIEARDSETLMAWRNLPEVSKYMYSDHEISEGEHRSWFAEAITDRKRHYWVITLDGKDVGLANVYNIDPQHSRADWAFYLVDPSVRGRGVGSYVEYSVLKYVFDKRGLNKLGCEVIATNTAVVAMHISFGFTEEGILRQHVYKEGQFVDVIRLGILAPEWRSSEPSVRRRLIEKGVVADDEER